MDIDELCAEVNRILAKEGIKVTDGRTAPVVTPRNVRYYRTVGLLDAPARKGGRAAYDGSHVEAIAGIKRAQAAGKSLEELRREREIESGSFRELSPFVALRGGIRSGRSAEQSMMLMPFAMHAMNPDLKMVAGRGDLGWSVRIGDATLSGSGPAPTKAQIEAIQAILAAGEGD